jgi:hypothetical protein
LFASCSSKYACAPGGSAWISLQDILKAKLDTMKENSHPVAAPMGFDIAAMLAGGEYHGFELKGAVLPDNSPLLGRYKFGPDFFRPNATLEFASSEDGLILKWPGGPDAVVVVADDHHFIDRHYWQKFSVADDANGRGLELAYGKFKGQRVTDSAPQSSH